MTKTYYVYMTANPSHTAIYTGVTNNLTRRIHQHKTKYKHGFTEQYNALKLIYFETYQSPSLAIDREKQIKNYSRRRKISLINNFNKHWKDLYLYIGSNGTDAGVT